jgi:hypothetical protein
MDRKASGVIFRSLSIVGVSLYLVSVYMLLRLKRRIRPPFSLVELLRARMRSPYRGKLAGFTSEQGYCWLAGVPEFIFSDKESFSRLIVLEDGKPLAAPHAAHDAIRSVGKGTYSHWGGVIYLSSSDNSDPSKNGRTYEVVEQR